jgi:hypothetical protein
MGAIRAGAYLNIVRTGSQLHGSAHIVQPVLASAERYPDWPAGYRHDPRPAPHR